MCITEDEERDLEVLNPAQSSVRMSVLIKGLDIYNPGLSSKILHFFRGKWSRGMIFASHHSLSMSVKGPGFKSPFVHGFFGF